MTRIPLLRSFIVPSCAAFLSSRRLTRLMTRVCKPACSESLPNVASGSLIDDDLIWLPRLRLSLCLLRLALYGVAGCMKHRLFHKYVHIVSYNHRPTISISSAPSAAVLGLSAAFEAASLVQLSTWSLTLGRVSSCSTSSSAYSLASK